MSKDRSEQDIPPKLTWSLDIHGPEFTDDEGFLYAFYNMLPDTRLKIHTSDNQTAFLKRDMRSDYLEVLELMLERFMALNPHVTSVEIQRQNGNDYIATPEKPYLSKLSESLAELNHLRAVGQIAADEYSERLQVILDSEVELEESFSSDLSSLLKSRKS